MKQRILIVDDSAVMRKNVRSILSTSGYEVVAEAVNGEEGVLAYRTHRPDLVTMDVTMPFMNGIEAVKEIIAFDPDAVILVISAFDQRSMLFEAMERGAKRYIVKPITADKLLQAVRGLLGEGGGRRYGDDAGSNNSRGNNGGGGGSYGNGRGEQAVSRGEGAAEASEEGGDAGATVGSAVDGANALAPVVPVRIENRDGAFRLMLTPDTTPAALEAVRPALQGLLFIRPLRLAFDFGAMTHADEPLLRLIDELLQSLAAAGGDVAFVAANPALREQLQRRLPRVPVHADA
jgi:two-component system chemotaxis response regulator CheY